LFGITKNSLASSIPLLALFTSEMVKVLFYLQLKDTAVDTHFIFILWISLQVAFSVVGGVLSDRLSRKYMLALAASAKLIAGFLCCQEFFVTAVIIDGVFGNLSPIARAAYCDVHMRQGRVPNIVNTFFMAPLGAIFFYFLTFLNIEIFVAFAACIVSAFLVLFVFEDFRDNQHSEVYVWKKLFKKESVLVALAFLLLNSQWAVLYHQDHFHLSVMNLGSVFFVLVGSAFLCGVTLTRLFKFKPERILIFVFIIITCIFFFDLLVDCITQDCTQVSPDMFLQFTLLGGVGQPLVYGFFGDKVTIHEQGAAYGLLESIQAFSEFVAPALLIFIKESQNFYLILLPVSIVSTILICMALYKYQKPKLPTH
jgi:MFS family permease